MEFTRLEDNPLVQKLGIRVFKDEEEAIFHTMEEVTQIKLGDYVQWNCFLTTEVLLGEEHIRQWQARIGKVIRIEEDRWHSDASDGYMRKRLLYIEWLTKCKDQTDIPEPEREQEGDSKWAWRFKRIPEEEALSIYTLEKL